MSFFQAQTDYDVIIIGAGVSGSFMAKDLTEAGAKCLLLEAGKFFSRTTYPTKEIDANSQLYWSGGIELNTSASLALLRPKVVGGGSIVNQALLDRFDDMALDSWKEVSGVSYFSKSEMNPWYEAAEKEIAIQEIPAEFRNGNAHIFSEGFRKNGFQCAPLIRGQSNCAFEQGNDCIECLSGCRINSKQSTPHTLLKKAILKGLKIIPNFEVTQVQSGSDVNLVSGIYLGTQKYTFKAKKIVMASGAIGNARLLLHSGFGKKLPALGKNFFTHPQFMTLALYEKEINAHKGPLQSFKSADPNFRKNGYKLENVFAPPVAISMLLPGIGAKHQSYMKSITHMACIEVAIRDSQAGSIAVNSKGKAIIKKELGPEDLERKNKGMKSIYQIFESTGAQEIIAGKLGIGLHLMGALGMGTDPSKSVVDPEFKLHRYKNIYVADSSIFPNAPGINPSLTIMALAKKAAALMIKEAS